MAHHQGGISGPVSVIGDVHGQADQLAGLLERLQSRPDFSDRWVILLGDLIDRGPDPKGVLDLVIELQDRHPRTLILCGNHELEMMRALGWWPFERDPQPDAEWLRGYGAETTFRSYGAPHGDLPALRERLPEAHARLLRNLPWCGEHPSYLFVHAGLDPDLAYDLQLTILRTRSQTTGRVPWLCSKRLAKSDPPPDTPVTVVSAHVFVPQVELRKRRILTGTTDGLRGRLSAVLLPEQEVID